MAEIAGLVEILGEERAPKDLASRLRSDAARPGLRRLLAVLDAAADGSECWTRPQVDAVVAAARAIASAVLFASVEQVEPVVAAILGRSVEFCISYLERSAFDGSDLGLQVHSENSVRSAVCRRARNRPNRRARGVTAIALAEKLPERERTEDDQGEPLKVSEANGGGGHRDPGGANGHKPNHDVRRQRQNFAPSPKISCYVCGENHWARDCPNKGKGKQVAAVQAAESKDEDVVELLRMGALRLVNAVRGQPSDDKLCRRELMFVDVILNGRTTQAMIDTGATHNFVAEAEAKRLGLTLEKDASRIKAVNSEPRPIAGVAKGVEIAIGPWRGKANLTVGPLDDFGVILGMDFLVSLKAAPVPYLSVLSIMNESAPCIVSMCRGEPTKDLALTALQLYKEVKCRKAKKLEEEDLSGGETVKSLAALKLPAPNQGMNNCSVKQESEESKGRSAAWQNARACRGGHAHLANSSHSGLASAHA